MHEILHPRFTTRACPSLLFVGGFPAPCMLTALALSPIAHGADKHWNVASGQWGVAGNWLPTGVPLPGDHVFIGSTAAAENAFVTLSAGTTVQSIAITDGMMLDTNNFTLFVPGSVLISGSNYIPRWGVVYPSRLRVDTANTQLGSGRVDLDGSVSGRTLNITLAAINGSDYAELTINGDISVSNSAWRLITAPITLRGTVSAAIGTNRPVPVHQRGPGAGGPPPVEPGGPGALHRAHHRHSGLRRAGHGESHAGRARRLQLQHVPLSAERHPHG